MHRLAHRVRPALRSLRRVHTGPQESASATGTAKLPGWATAAAYTAGLAATYYGVSKLTEPAKKPAHAPKHEVKATKPAFELAHAHDASAVEPTALVASSTDAPPADASVTTDNALTESHSGEKHAEVVVEGEDGEPVEGGAPKVAAPYDPETGEFNWDCPCLGGLPDTVCGEQFKDSFRCFIKSEAEPKGMDCIEAFNAMQQCFREHPEVYAREIQIYDEVDKEDESAGEDAPDAEGQLDKSVTSPKSTGDSLPPSPASSSADPLPSDTLVDSAAGDKPSDVKEPWGEAHQSSPQAMPTAAKSAATSKPASTPSRVVTASTEAKS